eukprot:TRINITY_DN17583_c0_g2_i2.p1 TRINITY_DN17583_c0_g2~~TRINITY_DN17583_c0_g2_i2.p1  ORF type:complete len:293 (-),score=49.38 TRINITY_DN17583_c0_g2_i2:649-1452(-)
MSISLEEEGRTVNNRCLSNNDFILLLPCLAPEALKVVKHNSVTNVSFSSSSGQKFIDIMNKLGTCTRYDWIDSGINKFKFLLHSDSVIPKRITDLTSTDHKATQIHSWTPNDSYLMFSSDSSLYLTYMDKSYLTVLWPATTRMDIPSSLAYYPLDNNFIAIGTLGGMLVIKRVSKVDLLVLLSSGPRINDICFATVKGKGPDKVMLLVISADGKLNVWRILSDNTQFSIKCEAIFMKNRSFQNSQPRLRLSWDNQAFFIHDQTHVEL